MSDDEKLNNDKVSAQLAVLDCMRRFSLQQFTNLMPGVQLGELNGSLDLSRDHWVASVLLTYSKAQVAMRVHFSSGAGRAILAANVNDDPRSLQPLTAQDFLKEYCNIVMGKVKAILTAGIRDEVQKVFLPQIEPSFDRYGWIPRPDEEKTGECWWRLHWMGGELIVYGRATAAQGFDENVLKALSEEKIVSMDDGGDIDFF